MQIILLVRDGYRVFQLLMFSLIFSEALMTIPLSHWNESDRLALLFFKSGITEDPLGALSSWNNTLHHCDWQGVTCSLRHRDRVTMLDLQSLKLKGTLSPYIGNLTFLNEIRLHQNNFYGEIPGEVSRLFRLQRIFLANNSFDGELPTNLSHCSNLNTISLDGNRLSGNILPELSSLSQLQKLFLDNNRFTGNIPPSLANLSSLTILSLSQNQLEGIIPEDYCQIQSLGFFSVYANNLIGKIPFCLYNNSNMYVFAVSNNQLEGSVPPNIGLTLPRIEGIYMGVNKFSGHLPVSLSNATRLDTILFGGNSFVGSVPSDWGRLPNLLRVEIFKNHLGTKTGDDLKFIDSLTNCTNLSDLEFGTNFLRGQLPVSLSNLSTTLRYISFRENEIYGSIPPGVFNLLSIKVIYLYRNHLTGNIPVHLGNLNQVVDLRLYENMLSGHLPASLGNMTQLQILDLGENNFSGSIPPTLGNCLSLAALILAQNNITGEIPKEVISLSSLTFVLSLQQNSLSGPLPSEIGNLTKLTVLSVAQNKFSGPIPQSLGNCLSLVNLSMDGNFFEGEIPKSFGGLRGLEHLDLSSNKLSGDIPKYLETFGLLSLNLSFNQLQGQVPNSGVFSNASLFSLIGNTNLCGGITELNLPPCIKNKKKRSFPFKVVIPIVMGSICLLVLSCLFLMCHRRNILKQKPSSTTMFDELYKRISYSDLLKATNGFSTDNLIGVGSFGSVFKGFLEDVNQIVSVKVFNLQQQGATESFLTECMALKNLRHRNLVKIITSCSGVDFEGNDFKALVFEFMPNGSLDDWLYPRLDARLGPLDLNFIQKLNIAIDIASGLEHLHHQCSPRIVHCDLKPSNILLNDELTALVADFGISEIFSTGSPGPSSSAGVRGTMGYVAPEYGMGYAVSIQGDVYSYGILLLEMFTRKKPTDDMFVDGLTLHSYCKTALQDQGMAIMGEMLRINNFDKGSMLGECLVSAIRLGVACSVEVPGERTVMNEVITELHHIKTRIDMSGDIN